MYVESDGYLYGYPTGYGTFVFTVKVTDSASPTADVATAVLSLTITAPAPLTVTTTTLAPGSQGAYYQAPLAATGGVGNDTWSVTSAPSLPAGLTLESDGYVYGTPTASGSFGFTVGVTDSATPTPDVHVGCVHPDRRRCTTAHSQHHLTKCRNPRGIATRHHSGGRRSRLRHLVSRPRAPSLVPRLTLDSYGDLYGTPTTSGSFSFIAQVTDQATPTADVASRHSP